LLEVHDAVRRLAGSVGLVQISPNEHRIRIGFALVAP
jgi:hypothetical protein